MIIYPNLFLDIEIICPKLLKCPYIFIWHLILSCCLRKRVFSYISGLLEMPRFTLLECWSSTFISLICPFCFPHFSRFNYLYFSWLCHILSLVQMALPLEIPIPCCPSRLNSSIISSMIVCTIPSCIKKAVPAVLGSGVAHFITWHCGRCYGLIRDFTSFTPHLRLPLEKKSNTL